MIAVVTPCESKNGQNDPPQGPRGGRPFVVSRGSLAGRALSEFAGDVEMTDMTRVLLQQVEQDPLKRRRIGAVPPLARLADLSQIMGLHDGPGPRGLGVQGRGQPGECLL